MLNIDEKLQNVILSGARMLFDKLLSGKEVFYDKFQWEFKGITCFRDINLKELPVSVIYSPSFGSI